MIVTGIHKENKNKVWFDTSWSWGNSYHVCRVLSFGEKQEFKGGIGGSDNRFGIEPSNYHWGVQGKIVIYKDGGYKYIHSGITFEYENDENFLATIDLHPEGNLWNLDD